MTAHNSPSFALPIGQTFMLYVASILLAIQLHANSPPTGAANVAICDEEQAQQSSKIVNKLRAQFSHEVKLKDAKVEILQEILDTKLAEIEAQIPALIEQIAHDKKLDIVLPKTTAQRYATKAEDVTSTLANLIDARFASMALRR
jgi:hypothetical protein